MQLSLRAFVGAGVLALHVSALAGVEGTILTDVAKVQSPVNFTAGSSVGVAAFDVTVSNVGGNVANAVVFTGKATAGTYLSAEGAACTGTGVDVSCSFGQMRPGDVRAFTVLYTTPAGPTPTKLSFTGLTLFSEGTGGAKSKPQNSKSTDTDEVNLAAASGTSTQSVVPGNGQFFTLGTVPGDGFSTRVTVPPQSAHTTATIVEQTFSSTCDNFIGCFKTTLTIPGAFEESPFLQIVLHQDKLNIKPGTQIGSVQIWYDPDGAAGEVQVGPCPTGPQPVGGGIPCIVEAKHYKNSSVPGWTPELDGDMVWLLINTLNGSFRLH
jgi:hypothetical protein